MTTVRWVERVADILERKAVDHIICRINANKCIECLVLTFFRYESKNFLQQELTVPCAAAIAQDILYQGFILFIFPSSCKANLITKFRYLILLFLLFFLLLTLPSMTSNYLCFNLFDTKINS